MAFVIPVIWPIHPVEFVLILGKESASNKEVVVGWEKNQRICKKGQGMIQAFGNGIASPLVIIRYCSSMRSLETAFE
ncbi:hypothetical protein ACCI51_12015 [Microbulbifer echini]|uniref:Uncharacterized protein n=1 Tax=Microbulbifer echini TaxID=1529067 RepID=A0ABV4NP06_9GAMM